MIKKTILATLLMTSNAYAEEVLLGAKPYPTSCKTGMTCNIAADHSILLKNTASLERCYIVTYRICYQRECYTNEFNIKVGPGQTYYDKKIINLFKEFDYQSKHEIRYYTAVNSPYINKQTEIIQQIDVG